MQLTTVDFISIFDITSTDLLKQTLKYLSTDLVAILDLFSDKVWSNVLFRSRLIFDVSPRFGSADAKDGVDGMGGDVAEVVPEPTDGHHQEVVDAGEQRLQQEVGRRV